MRTLKPRNCEEIVKQYLKENGFDGLATTDCGCSVEDFAPCGEDFSQCRPAHAKDGIFFVSQVRL